MTRCLFASDLHGSLERYRRLLAVLERERPDALFLGGDLLPGLGVGPGEEAPPADFFGDFLLPELERLRRALGPRTPRVLAILGNDDPRSSEPGLRAGEDAGLLEYLHRRRTTLAGRDVYGYACVPPTPFRLKDFERYDVSRYVDPGCVSPEQGDRSVPADPSDVRYGTIAGDLAELTGDRELGEAVFLFHTPPYRTCLDRAALDGKLIDHVPLDVHVGSIAVRRLIEERGPALTLHGHVHEAPRLTGDFRDRLGRTRMLTAAHDGPELALVRFELERPEHATRELL